jgi:spermidine/putrescine transport system permease protein
MVVTSLIYVFLWAPLIILVIFSFNSNKFGGEWENFTLEWYSNIYHNVEARNALARSSVIACITVVVSTIGGTLAAYGLYKYKFRGRKLLRMSLLIPIVMPYIVMGAALLVFFPRVIHIPLGYPAIIIAHISFSIPLAVFVILGRMARIDWTLEEASVDLGATKFTTWRKIILPLLLPAIIASAALIFPWSFNDFTLTYFVSGIRTATLPIYIFTRLRFGSTPMINTVGTIFMLFPAIGIVIAAFLQRKRVI